MASSRGWFPEAATRGWLTRHSLIRAYIGQLLIVAACGSVAALISWLIYECSNTVEQRMIPGGSNDKRLTDIDTCNCYICKVVQYLTSHEALLCAFTYALVYYGVNSEIIMYRGFTSGQHSYNVTQPRSHPQDKADGTQTVCTQQRH